MVGPVVSPSLLVLHSRPLSPTFSGKRKGVFRGTKNLVMIHSPYAHFIINEAFYFFTILDLSWVFCLAF